MIISKIYFKYNFDFTAVMTKLSLNINNINNGERYNVRIDKNKKIIDLKNEIHKKIKNINMLDFNLIHCGSILSNDDNINILDNETCIHLNIIEHFIEEKNNDNKCKNIKINPIDKDNCNLKMETLNETTDEDNYDDDTTDDEYDEPHLLEELYLLFNPNRNKQRFGGFISISDYYKSIDEIEYFKKNRIINSDHIKNLTSVFNIELMDGIKLGYYDDKLYVVNGQHRHYILLNNKEKFNKPGIDILIDVTICRTKLELENIINTSNNSRSFDSSELNEFKMDKIKKILNEQYKRDLFRKNFPYIKSTKFESKLQKNKFYSENSVQTIVNQLLKINNLLKQRYLIGGLGENYDKKLLKQFKKHEWFINKHFYLGIDKKMKWMAIIDSI